jgi:hypothetical protein
MPEGLRKKLRQVQVGLSLTHVHGPKVVDVAPNDAVVTCVVKNGEFYVDQFIEHYMRLGFRHVCFLDNGSTDATIERAKAHPRVTIYRSTMSVGDHQGLLKTALAQRTVAAGWCLDVDIDEFFDYPGSDVVRLPQFLDYLNTKGSTAVLTQMLDMFSDRTLGELRREGREDLQRVHRFYDISQVRKIPYSEDRLVRAHGARNRIAHAETVVQWGGIRKIVYGVDNCLTKHSLFRTGVGLELFPHVHFVNGAQLADVSGILLHYKFAGNAVDEAARNKAAFTAISDGYERMVEVMERRPDLVIKTDTALEFRSAADLLDAGFGFASTDYRLLAGREISRPLAAHRSF